METVAGQWSQALGGSDSGGDTHQTLGMCCSQASEKTPEGKGEATPTSSQTRQQGITSHIT